MINKMINKIKIRNKGKNNNINLTKNVILRKNSKIRVNGSNNVVTINDGVYTNLEIFIDGNNHLLNILDSNRINGCKIIIKNNSNSVHIGKDTGLIKSLIVSCGKNNKIFIDDDCMISTNVEIWGCDGHSILQNNEIINLSKSVYIGKHTWIGANSKILKGANIPDGCVVGSNSLVTAKVFQSNTLIAGNPAKKIKENITWTVENLEN